MADSTYERFADSALRAADAGGFLGAAHMATRFALDQCGDLAHGRRTISVGLTMLQQRVESVQRSPVYAAALRPTWARHLNEDRSE